ncbi:SusD/RagB family nutrient-binding outer membrane lipoprotein [Polaribacter sargassicola]|uniref:SusD/RagB family nutrient-binding outer membrane lipoprotein n=1 Tax=Polaribacter sargassicola TaxID=2836891 RepID=UPI001F1EEA77|nr:SusD/RagB family nutrient-binding outer membrane lipoprotein [Polaribacter sp. DS7-9]MCG1035707.1 SusD/RagB family nutrient-binding outer membrane lipoprotein [Polaribacter sp. DS7-9]
MKKLNKLKALVALVSILIFTACDTVDFGDINTSPNSATVGSTALLLTGVERSVAGYTTQVIPNLYSQYISEGQYPESSQYDDDTFAFSYGPFIEIQRIIDLCTDPETSTNAAANGPVNNQIAAASLLRVFFFKHMAERWGMIPYTEALQGLENTYPKYDDQLTVYKSLIDEIDTALALITDGDIEGDYIFGGDMTKWSTFGNTMKMVMALTLSNADATTGQTAFNEAISGAISSNSENLVYPFLDDDLNDNAWQDRFETRVDYLLSDTFVNALIGTGTNLAPEDPRLEKMGEPALNTGVYTGAPYGAQNTALAEYSYITSDIIYNGSREMPIYTYAQVLFARSEAAALGWTSEDAASLYEQGISASMEQWGVNSTDADTYIAENPYTDANDMAYEKWVAGFLMGYDTWTDWRRQKSLGYERPLSPPAILQGNATGIPNRHGYSTQEPLTNAENYNEAVQLQGPDDLNTILALFK